MRIQWDKIILSKFIWISVKRIIMRIKQKKHFEHPVKRMILHYHIQCDIYFIYLKSTWIITNSLLNYSNSYKWMVRIYRLVMKHLFISWKHVCRTICVGNNNSNLKIYNHRMINWLLQIPVKIMIKRRMMWNR